MINFSKALLSDLGALMFPENCSICRTQLLGNEKHICINCQKTLDGNGVGTNLGRLIKNRLAGRIPIDHAISFLKFEKGGSVQRLLNSIKYKGNKDLAREVTLRLALKKQKALRKLDIDLILPVPLHFRKEKIRGFNQSRELALGISSVIRAPVGSQLKRVRFTQSQTKKSKAERWNNVENAFFAEDPKSIKGKKVLLIDDVFTTGATIEACGTELLKNGILTLSVVTLAVADH